MKRWEEGEDQRADLFKVGESHLEIFLSFSWINICRNLNFSPPQKIDDNGDGAISFDEWLAFVINKYKGGHDNNNYCGNFHPNCDNKLSKYT